MLNKEKNVQPTSKSGNDAKPIVIRRSEFVIRCLLVIGLIYYSYDDIQRQKYLTGILEAVIAVVLIAFYWSIYKPKPPFV